MNKTRRLPLVVGIVLLSVLLSVVGVLVARNYSSRLCSKPGYTCIRAKRGDTWNRLFPNSRQQKIVRRVNRTNGRLRSGMVIAVPRNLGRISYMDVSPLPRRLEPRGKKFLLIKLGLHAFGAYDRHGYLLRWGPVSGGKGYCPDVRRRCRTPVGRFRVSSKRGAGCASRKYPIGKGGAPMPYCMFFYKGYAMHGSHLPGYHASHGCIRMFREDAQWLNHQFAGIGTLVIVKW